MQELIKEFELKAHDLEEKMNKERDQQIELVIARFSEENDDIDAKAFTKYQRKLDELTVSKSNEITNLQRKIKVLENQLEGLKINFQELETEKLNSDKEKEGLMANSIEKEKEITKMIAEVQKLKSQTSVSDEIIESLERNFTRRIDREKENYEQRLADLRRENDDIRTNHFKELEELTEKQGKELETMEDRVKKVVGRKDNEITRLSEEMKQKSLEIEKYKELLDRQRRDLMKK
jgi:chromosome segregation ATPase